MKCPDCKGEMVDFKNGIWKCWCGLCVEEQLSQDKIEYLTFREDN